MVRDSVIGHRLGFPLFWESDYHIPGMAFFCFRRDIYRVRRGLRVAFPANIWFITSRFICFMGQNKEKMFIIPGLFGKFAENSFSPMRNIKCIQARCFWRPYENNA